MYHEPTIIILSTRIVFSNFDVIESININLFTIFSKIINVLKIWHYKYFNVFMNLNKFDVIINFF